MGKLDGTKAYLRQTRGARSSYSGRVNMPGSKMYLFGFLFLLANLVACSQTTPGDGSMPCKTCGRDYSEHFLRLGIKKFTKRTAGSLHKWFSEYMGFMVGLPAYLNLGLLNLSSKFPELPIIDMDQLFAFYQRDCILKVEEIYEKVSKDAVLKATKDMVIQWTDIEGSIVPALEGIFRKHDLQMAELIKSFKAKILKTPETPRIVKVRAFWLLNEFQRRHTTFARLYYHLIVAESLAYPTSMILNELREHKKSICTMGAIMEEMSACARHCENVLKVSTACKYEYDDVSNIRWLISTCKLAFAAAADCAYMISRFTECREQCADYPVQFSNAARESRIMIAQTEAEFEERIPLLLKAKQLREKQHNKQQKRQDRKGKKKRN